MQILLDYLIFIFMNINENIKNWLKKNKKKEKLSSFILPLHRAKRNLLYKSLLESILKNVVAKWAFNANFTRITILHINEY